MILPSRLTLWALAALSLLFLAAAAEPMLLWVGVGADLMVLGLVGLEGRSLRRQPLVVECRWERQLQINRPAALALTLENHGRRRLTVQLRQPWPATVEGDIDACTLTLGPGERVRTTLAATPLRRGRLTLPPLEIDLASAPHGLAHVRRLEPAPEAIVYPDLHRVAEYEELRRSRSLRQAGFHRQRLVGQGREFEQMREYLPGDDFRDVNWKATARLQRPITNLHQAERSRDVLICVDLGRMMGGPVGTGTTLDRAVDAALMLAHVARSQGDRVGLLSFADAVETVLMPSGSAATAHLILERLALAEPRPVFSSFASLVETLRQRLSHRSLVFVFTDLSDPQLTADLAELMPLVSRRHLVIVVGLRDALLSEVAAGPAADAQEAYEVLAARQLTTERDAHHRELRNAGVQVLEADADRLQMATINRYMAVKSRQLL